MVLQSSGAISLNDIQNEFGGSNPIGINEYYGVASGIPSSGTISLNQFYGASGDTWEIIMHTDGYKGSGNNIGNSTAFGETGTSNFKTHNATSTGAYNRRQIGHGVGLYAAFFYKKNIKQFALISGSGGQNNLQSYSSHSSYHVWNTFGADRDGYTDTGNESLHEIIDRLDTYNLNNANWGGNDSPFNGTSIRNFTAGPAGYSTQGSYAHPNPATMKAVPLSSGASFSHTFTNAGATGRTGPTLSQVQSAYSGSGVSVSMNVQGIQLWTVPTTGTYEIEVAGAHGGGWYGGQGYANFHGGNGGWVKGTVTLTQGTVLAIIVGQQGSDMLQPGGAGGGGGASFVMQNSYFASFYGVAGGGGGCNGPVHTYNPYGGDGGSSQGNGSDTGGGAHGNYGNGGGCGFNNNGSGSPSQLGGTAPYIWVGYQQVSSPVGGDHTYGGGATGYSVRYPVDGGFGGGGASSWHTAGGGGGWAGGDGVSWSPPGGYGGTTYGGMNNMTFGTHTASHGYVKITAVASTSVPDKFAIWGINRDSDNDTQVLAAYPGTLAVGNGKSDYWRNNNPPDLYWSYWGNDWHYSSPTQTISKGKQTDPGISTRVTSGHTGSVYLIAYGPASTIPATPPASNQALYSFSSHTFTPAGATGQNGPTITQCRNTYSVTWDSTYLNMSTQGIQQWTVPKTRSYTIVCRGASGGAFGVNYYDAFPGGGATITGTFSLTRGTILNIVVGQKPTSTSSHGIYGSAGGGASWVYTGSIGSSGLMIVAGGGGGVGHGSNNTTAGNGKGGSSGTNSNEASYYSATVGSGSNARTGTGSAGNKGIGEGGRGTHGNHTQNHGSGGGAGWNSNGNNDESSGGPSGYGGTRFVGGNGGSSSTHDNGGFGGGGGSGGNGNSGGGGGGYTGGGAGQGWTGWHWGGGGGGGSYNAGTSQSLQAGGDAISTGQVHDGWVAITAI